MNFKRISAVTLAAVMAAAMTLPAAMADEMPVVVDDNVIQDVNHVQGDIMLLSNPVGMPVVVDPDVIKGVNGIQGDIMLINNPVAMPVMGVPTVGVGYTAQLYLNGEAVDASGIPAAPAYGMLPLRLIAEADGGSAEWFAEELMSYFFLENCRITVHFDDFSIELDDNKVEGTAALIDGVTFIPADVLNLVGGYDVNLNEAMDVDRIDITSPNGEPVKKMVKGIIEEVGMAAPMQVAAEELEFFGIDAANFSRFIGFAPMNIRADHIFVAQYADNADKAAAKEQFEARLKAVQDSFANYLPDSYEMALKGQVVESQDGQWLMLIISEDNAKAIELFEAGLAKLAQTPVVPLPKEPIFVMPVPQV